jgi:hypothetical protein
MNIRNIISGFIIAAIGVWIYFAMSSFEIEEGSNPKKLVIREGNVRTETEVAKALADEMNFDLEGAYKTGYTPMDVVEYLINHPHKRSFSFYEGRWYEGRITLLRIVPLSVCIIFIVIGVAMVIFAGRSKKS